MGCSHTERAHQCGQQVMVFRVGLGGRWVGLRRLGRAATASTRKGRWRGELGKGNEEGVKKGDGRAISRDTKGSK
eukprot:scaffold5987_cov203-Amphora_coffeaeformis.AAC.11